MAGLYGELSLAPASPAPATLAAMERAMADWGPDGGGRWQEGPLALGARLLHIRPQDTQDCQPLIESDLVLAGHIRLDDRDNLARELGVARAAWPTLPDSRLVALAWRRWGEACAQHLYGDWVCAIWDRRRRRLWIGRDAAGNTGLYFWHDARRLVFATSIKALLVHPAIPKRPDADYLARLLTVFHDPARADSTAYADIRRLPGGCALCAGPGGVAVERWWYPERLSEFAAAPGGDYLSAFRDVYGRAVQDRLCTAAGPVALMLSAGLDSGSVAALAAPRLAARGERLVAYTSVPHFGPASALWASRLGDEGPLARATAEHIGNIEFIPIAAPRADLVGAIERMLELHDQPQHGVANAYWILDILAQARQHGVRVLLTGQGGNATVSWSGTGSLLPALLGGRWGALRAALRDSPLGAGQLIKRRLVRPLLAPARQAVQRIGRRGAVPWGQYSAINPAFAADLRLARRMRAARCNGDFSTLFDPRHPLLAQFRLGRRGSTTLGAAWMENGAAHRLEVRDPTRDRRVIEFCWQTPDPVFWAQGRGRGLIRAGFSGDLPDAVLHPGPRGLQGADVGYRLNQERAAVGAALARLTAHPLARAWLDLPKMHAAYQDLGQAVTRDTSRRALTILLRGLGVGLFLLRF
ncbi:asparagine synthase-related protein [uncultured Thiodictyon sp.]|uniref:asparagine synthetase B family protein n=1 Tax=uncultured Thiodictyon sp. TaxID=1846217 RepID=UPI0025E918D8|nr:asparagine synthase-related protein [uncultured Thiodictyon sp.]